MFRKKGNQAIPITPKKPVTGLELPDEKTKKIGELGDLSFTRILKEQNMATSRFALENNPALMTQDNIKRINDDTDEILELKIKEQKKNRRN